MSDWDGAKWIWLDQPERLPRNQTVLFRKTFDLPDVPAAATLRITADSQYRLFVNGTWVADGPCRSWPAHFKYDEVDLTGLLRAGANAIAVIARHWGVTTFHRLPREAGLLALLEMRTPHGQSLFVPTESSWKAIESAAHRSDTPRISIQMEQAERYDATAELSGALDVGFDDRDWPAAREYHDAEAGPWKDLRPRDVKPLTREPLFPRSFAGATVVAGGATAVAVDLKQLAYPDDVSANNIVVDGVLATVIECASPRELRFAAGGKARLNGKPVEDGLLRLTPDGNLLTIEVHARGHAYDFPVWFETTEGLEFIDDQRPWMWTGAYSSVDPMTTPWYPLRELPAPTAAAIERIALAGSADDLIRLQSPFRHLVPQWCVAPDDFAVFRHRRPIRAASDLVDDPGAMLSDDRRWTTVRPTADGDVELCLDFGRETVGYVAFEMDAPAGTVVDSFLIEYQDEQGNLQHTDGNRNGFRYVCKAGVNRYVSMKRRAGRYLYVTLREMTGPVRIRHVHLIQSTYPVDRRGSFRCSDPTLDRIWEMSVLTLQLCMEDTFTDCPLFEQTLWVGDARNEALYAATVFGADDLVRRCLRLAAESLERLELVGCQVPSGWDVILPAWSFLWTINVWDHYFQTGDESVLREFWPAVVKNLRAAEKRCTDRGLFSLPGGWNLFDWAGIDQDHATVLHNSLFLIGALDAAIRCADVIGAPEAAWLRSFRDRVRDAVLPLWDEAKGSYPDSIHKDGTISPKTSQHTSALAALYDVLPAGTLDAARKNVTDPPAGMTRVGSPFAFQYFIEAMEKTGDVPAAVAWIRRLWKDMLDTGATTCWETFRGWEKGRLTRSHCHAWSSAPIYAFHRLVAGIVPVAPGAMKVVISPHPCGLEWATATTHSPRGELRVAWRIEAGTMWIDVAMPEGVEWEVQPNADWVGVRELVVNGAPMRFSRSA